MTHHTSRTSFLRGSVALLAASTLFFGSAACSSSGDATSDSAQAHSGDQVASGTGGEGGEHNDGGQGAHSSSNGAVDTLSDEAMNEVFSDRYIQTCDVGVGFYMASYFERDIRVLEPQGGSILNRDPKCTGYVRAAEDDVYAYVEINIVKDFDAQAVRAQPGMKPPKDPALSDWKESSVGPVGMAAGTCTLLSPPGRSVSPIYISVSRDCSLAYPLARNFQDLDVRRQQMQGKGEAGEYVGTGEPSSVSLIDEQFRGKLEEAKPQTEEVTTKVGGEEVQAKLSNFRVRGYDKLNYGQLCVDVVLKKAGEEVKGAAYDSFYLVQADGTPIPMDKDLGGKSGQKLCSKQALTIVNTDFFIGNYEEDSVSEGVKIDDITPLWRATSDLSELPYKVAT